MTAKRKLFWLTLLLLFSSVAIIVQNVPPPADPIETSRVPTKPQHGRIISVVSTEQFTTEQALSISRQNYGEAAPAPIGPITKALITYSSLGPNDQIITEYARLYMPADGNQLPIFAFAPGTTGIGDQCAASLEQPAVKNWQNYESHMITYAGQGYAVVIPDYEGMRDPMRMHHYMIGEMEGRALLDGISALQKWQPAEGRLDRTKIFVSGFSQGGHAAMWADKIATSYTPSLPIKGVATFGPVSSVKRTLADVTKGANINWFGPFVLTSYQDYYGSNLDPARILLPRWVPTLATEVTTHCIDSLIPHWGNHPDAVYTREFLQALATDTLAPSGYALVEQELQQNATGDTPTTSAKLINQGALDNVILPAQQIDMLPNLCAISRGPVLLSIYPKATHYNVMQEGLSPTLAWMKTVINNSAIPSNCPAR